MVKSVRRFKSKEAYRKWLAYGNIHGDQTMYIRGKKHKVVHKKR